jgi:ABC-type Mn2+/Zn2+ transport system ATPase subunit
MRIALARLLLSEPDLLLLDEPVCRVQIFGTLVIELGVEHGVSFYELMHFLHSRTREKKTVKKMSRHGFVEVFSR